MLAEKKTKYAVTATMTNVQICLLGTWCVSHMFVCVCVCVCVRVKTYLILCYVIALLDWIPSAAQNGIKIDLHKCVGQNVGLFQGVGSRDVASGKSGLER